jgi:hypothetical protein
MTNWPLNTASRYETIGATGGPPVNEGTICTTGAANTKGSYATMGTTTFQADGFFLTLLNTGTADRFRVDIAINTGGSDTIIVEDFWCENNGIAFHVHNWIPVRVPSGAAVKIRAQALGASRTLGALATMYSDPSRVGGSKIRSATDFTNTLPTNTLTLTGTTQTAWSEVCASTAARFCRLWAMPTNAGDATRTADRFIIDVGMGAAASEVVLGQFYMSSSTTALRVNSAIEFPCDIPAGKRLAFRVTCLNANTDSMSMACMGLVA